MKISDLTPKERKRRDDFIAFLDRNNVEYSINEKDDIMIDVKKTNRQIFDKDKLK